jgi:hypothetical protein
VVLSELHRSAQSDHLDDPRYGIDPRALAKKLHAIAYVIQLPYQVAHNWTNKVGSRWAAFNGAVRVYLPGLSFETDDNFRHPLHLFKSVMAWEHDDLRAEKAYTAYVQQRSLQFLADRRFNWSEHSFFTDIDRRRVELERARILEEAKRPASTEGKSVASITGQIELDAAEIEQLRAQREQLVEQTEKLQFELKDKVELAQMYADERDDFERQLDDEKSTNRKLTQKIRSLQLQFAQTNSADVIVADRRDPESYEDIEAWVDEELAGRLLLHSRAKRALRKSVQYQDLKLVVDCLRLLAFEYVDHRLGSIDRETFEIACQQLNVEACSVGSETTLKRFPEKYEVAYPPGRKSKLTHHIKKGSAHDDRHTLRIYYFFDADTDKVVVGWLPSHLKNTWT